MAFSITILGSNSAVPAHGRHPSAQIVHVQQKLYLVDCGEGTQMRFAQYGIRWNRINQIFISHLHGDHYFGLVGLISTFHLLKRNKPLDIFAPAGLEAILRLQLEAGNTQLCYPIQFHIVDTTAHQVIFENKELMVSSLPLNHRIPCCGFLFQEKTGDRKINKAKIEELALPHHLLHRIKAGEDVTDPKTGELLTNQSLTLPPLRARSYAYCSDTTYFAPLEEQVKGVDVLYHDCTFDKAGTQRAIDTYHGTTEQAARLAQKAGVKKLLIGHFSAKYDDLSPLLAESQAIFPDTELALEGKIVEIAR
jgi:ribonuclease Z